METTFSILNRGRAQAPVDDSYPRTALITGAVLYFAFSATAFIPGNHGVAVSDLFDMQQMHDAYTGGFADTFTEQARTGLRVLLFTALGQGISALGMLLIGMAAGNSGSCRTSPCCGGGHRGR
ncbi:hypothetical protein [Nocardia tengchongensis]|uniref:hypothetical protein n=1 Tax=Nocardia tengchongensis TaxID=2055889 RepID=UPI0036A134BE